MLSTVVYNISLQGIALMGRNTTGPPFGEYARHGVLRFTGQ